MNKSDFLNTLKARLAVLEPSEQQDILDEYAYHIDMRVSSGLSEDQAIQDFGDLDQLVALIFEAYHVNPNYQAQAAAQPEPEPVQAQTPPPPIQETPAGPSAWERCRAGLSAAAAAVGRFFSGLWNGLGRGVHAVGRWFGGLGRSIAGLFHRESREKTALEPVITSEDFVKGPGPLERAGSGFLRFCKAALWVAWNGFLLLCALPFALAGLAGLVAAGLLVVLLVQGYPLLGPLLILVGGLLCCAAILALGTNLIWHKIPRADCTMETEWEAYDDEND